MNEVFLAVDPGKFKCGIAVGTRESVIIHKVIPSVQLKSESMAIIDEYSISHILIGNATLSKSAGDVLKQFGLPITFVDEKNTSLEARKLYFKSNPPRGFYRFIPISLQAPPCPIDDYAAIIIMNRYFKA